MTAQLSPRIPESAAARAAMEPPAAWIFAAMSRAHADLLLGKVQLMLKKALLKTSNQRAQRLNVKQPAGQMSYAQSIVGARITDVFCGARIKRWQQAGLIQAHGFRCENMNLDCAANALSMVHRSQHPSSCIWTVISLLGVFINSDCSVYTFTHTNTRTLTRTAN